jgi:putative lipoprotein
MLRSTFAAARLRIAGLLILGFGLVSAAQFAPAQTANAEVTGAVTYRERTALPQDAVIDVQLLDISVADAAAPIMAESMINAEGRQVPVSFVLTYDPAKIVPSHRYSVRATIRSGDGMLLFTTTQAYPVITHGAPSKVTLVLHPVGHGAKPGATGKKTVSSQPKSTSAEPGTAMPSSAVASAAEAAATSPEQAAEKQAESSPNKDAEAAAETAVPPPAEKAEAPTPSTEASSAAEPPAEAKPETQIEPAKPEAEATETPPSLPDAPSETAKPENPNPEPETANSEPGPEPLPSASATSLSPLADTQWRLTQLGGINIVIAPAKRPITLAFSPEGTRIAGSAGCNSFVGTFTEDHGRLTLHPGGVTMMACTGPDMQREQKFVATLRSADGFRIDGDYLLLTSKGKIVAKFKNQFAP